MKLSTVDHDFTATVSMVGAFAILIVIFQTVRTLYLVFAGPLSKYPGPKLAKASRLPYAWYRSRGKAERWVTSLHEQYGDIVQISPNTLSYTTGHAWKDIYGFSIGGKTQNFPKCELQYGNRPVGIADIIYSNDTDHTRVRRNLSHAFSDRALREQQPLLKKYVDQLVSKLQERTGNPIDIVKWYNFTTFDIMADLTFGVPLGNLDQGEYTPWVAAIFQSIKSNTFLTEMKYFPMLKPFIKAMMPRGMIKERARHWALSAQQVDERIEKEKEDHRPDIWGMVLNAKEEQKLTVPEMHSNSQILMIAGTETTATLLSGLTYLLLSNPEKMEIVKKEIRDNFHSADEIDIDSVLKLKYVNACFEEALRCYPPVPTGLPRKLPKGGDMVCGQFVPEGTRVAVHQYATYHSPRNFHRPNEFIPERWLGDSEFQHDERAAMQPFSFGPRNCIGKNLAYLEMRLIFSNVLWNFDMSLSKESKDWANQEAYILWQKHPLMVELQPVHREVKGLL